MHGDASFSHIGATGRSFCRSNNTVVSGGNDLDNVVARNIQEIPGERRVRCGAALLCFTGAEGRDASDFATCSPLSPAIPAQCCRLDFADLDTIVFFHAHW
jgi:hypothetical protein